MRIFTAMRTKELFRFLGTRNFLAHGRPQLRLSRAPIISTPKINYGVIDPTHTQGTYYLVKLTSTLKTGKRIFTSPGREIMPSLSIKSLRLKDIDKAYPLAGNALPGMSLPQWRTFTASLLAGPGPEQDILAAISNTGHIRGLLAYRVRQDAVAPTLEILLICLPGFRSAPVSRALLSAAHAISRHFHCANVTIALPHGAVLPAGSAALSNVNVVRLSLQMFGR